MRVYDNKINDSEKKKIEESEEGFLFANNVSAKKRLSIGYKLSLKAYGYSVDNAPLLDKTFYSKKKTL